MSWRALNTSMELSAVIFARRGASAFAKFSYILLLLSGVAGIVTVDESGDGVAVDAREAEGDLQEIDIAPLRIEDILEGVKVGTGVEFGRVVAMVVHYKTPWRSSPLITKG